MRLWTDSRGQSIQIGAVLLFGILVVVLALYQAFVIPGQNEEIEFDHNQEVQKQLTELRSTAISMPGETTRKSVSVGMGVRYPARTIFVNPGPASGTLETVNPTSGDTGVTIENAGVVDEHRGVESFWNDTDPQYGTKAIEYRPGYNLYTDAPQTVYEHGTLYNQFGGGTTLPVTGQALVDDNRITLVALNGSLRENRVDSASVEFEPVSTRTESVWVSGQDGENITLELPSGLSNEGWNETLQSEPNAWVVENGDDDLVEIELADDVYELRLAKVGVGTEITGTDPAYIALTDGHRGTVDRGEAHPLTVEVRDKYNGPMRGVTVEATADDGSLESTEERTDRNGQATFEFNSTDVFVAGAETDVGIEFEADEGEFIENGSTTVDTTVTVRDRDDFDLPEPAFEAFWNVSAFGDEFDTDCEAAVDACIEVGTNNAQMAFETDPDTAAGFVDFAVDDRAVGTLNTYSGEFDDGAVDFDVRFDAEAVGLTNVTLFAGGDRDRVDIEVFGFGTLEGAVTNASDGEPIEDATVTVEETGDVATTDASGEYEIEDIPAGTVTVTVDAEDYQSETRADVEIETDETTEENFELEPGEQELPEEELYPNEEIVTTNLVSPGEGIDALRNNDENTWYEASDDSENTFIHVAMDEPSAELDGEQTVNVYVRASNETAGNQNPSVDIYLYEDGEQVLVEPIASENVVDADNYPGGQVVTGTFDPAVLEDTSGTDVEFVIEGTDTGQIGAPNQATIEVGYLTWLPG